MTYQNVNPHNGEKTKTFDDLSDAQFETALATAQSCFETWRHTSYAERATIVARASELMSARIDELAQTMTLEMGKRIGEARREVEKRWDATVPAARRVTRWTDRVRDH